MDVFGGDDDENFKKRVPDSPPKSGGEVVV